MKKQKSDTLPICKCREYQQQITKIRNKIMEQLNIVVKLDVYTAYRLVKMLVHKYTEREKYVAYIQSHLRNYVRQNTTIQYNENMPIEEMINSLFLKITKEKIIHTKVIQKEEELMKRYVKETRTAAEQIDYLKELLIQQQKQQQTWKNEALKQEKQNHSLKKQFQLKKQENRLLQNLVKQLQFKINSLEIKITSLQKDKAQLSKDYLLKSEQVSKLASNFQTFKGELSYNSKVQLNQQLKAIKSEMSLDGNPQTTRHTQKNNQTFFNEFSIYNHLFVGQVLLNEDQARRFLIQTIQNQSKNAIARTKFLYKLDYYNTTNIHKYVDGVPHLVILIGTDHGELIAAYSQGAFKPKTISNRDGLLINLTKQKVFTNSKKAIVYDENEIIFGNFDLKLKNGDNKLTSNFGSNNSFYQVKGETVNSLLGQGKNREVKMKTYEIFQVFYQI